MAVFNQLLGVFLVNGLAFALAVRAVFAALVRALIPVEAEPGQRLEDGGFAFRRRTGLVGVFDAQDELAALALGEGAVEQRDVSGADVRVAGRGWRNTGTDLGHAVAILLAGQRRRL